MDVGMLTRLILAAFLAAQCCLCPAPARAQQTVLTIPGTGDNQDSTTDQLSRDPSTAPRSTS